ncbi:MAG: DUF5105 domain-containing protein [Eubacteriales bacterium]|nr:DUF5105 domain-containing protein [Eubacteriales bacterium]
MKHLCRRFLLLLLVILSMTGCGYAGPEKAVERELRLIRDLDEETIKAFVSYEDIRISGSNGADIGPETTDAVKLFFKDFKYRIRSSSLGETGETAVVELSITNLDAKQLAKDLCKGMIRSSFDYGTPLEQQQGLASSFALMKKYLEDNTYERKTTEATVHLVKKEEEWIIQESAQLEDELTGGLVSCLQNPYLLTPEEVLDTTLLPFRDFSAAQWQNYLNIQDIFSTGSDQSDELDLLILTRLEELFDYEIVSVTQDGNNAAAQLRITSLDLPAIMEEYRSELLDYAQTTESIRSSDEELTQKTTDILLSVLKTQAASAVHTLYIPLVNNGHTWEVILDDAFTDALFGGLNSALDILREHN